MTDNINSVKFRSNRFSKLKKLGLSALLAGSVLLPSQANAQTPKQYIGVTAGWVNLGGDIGEIYPSGPIYGLVFSQETDPFTLEIQLNQMSSIAEQQSSSSYGFLSSSESERTRSLNIKSIDVNAIYKLMDIGLGIQGSYQNVEYDREFFERSRGLFFGGSNSDFETKRETYFGYGAFLNFQRPLETSNLNFRIGFKQTRNQQNPITIDQGYASVVYNFGLQRPKKVQRR